MLFLFPKGGDMWSFPKKKGNWPTPIQHHSLEVVTIIYIINPKYLSTKYITGKRDNPLKIDIINHHLRLLQGKSDPGVWKRWVPKPESFHPEHDPWRKIWGNCGNNRLTWIKSKFLFGWSLIVAGQEALFFNFSNSFGIKDVVFAKYPMWHGRFWRCYMTQLAATNEPLWAVQQLCDLGKKNLRYLSHPRFTKASIEILGSRLVYIRSMEWKSVFFRDWIIYNFLLSTNLPLQCLNRWHFPVI